MASILKRSDRPGRTVWAADGYERFLAAASVAMLAAVLAALVRGRAHWGDPGPIIWLHLATIIVALALTPVMLLRPRGNRWHRRLGWVWSAALVATAALSLGVRVINPGHFSFIHLLSILVLVQVPMIVWAGRTHQVARHRRIVRGMVTGALLIAGFFTFPFGRMMGAWLFG